MNTKFHCCRCITYQCSNVIWRTVPRNNYLRCLHYMLYTI
jgi:hypothetical protein